MNGELDIRPCYQRESMRLIRIDVLRRGTEEVVGQLPVMAFEQHWKPTEHSTIRLKIGSHRGREPLYVD